MPYFSRLARGDISWLAEAFIIMNVRLQAEDVNKQREFIFIDELGNPYSSTIGRKDRLIKTPGGERVSARTRLVFNLPIANLFIQILDTAMHNAELQHPFCSHNMYDPMASRSYVGALLAFDVSHFERSTAACVRLRARMLGGMYAAINGLFEGLPFLCPSDGWDSYHLLWPDREGGWSDQFASGHSAVAPAQKEIFIALYAQFALEVLRVPRHQCISWVLSGGDSRCLILNYGDDNAVFGDPGILSELLKFMQTYLHAAEEDPKKFLGFLWTKDGWRLGARSYITKTYVNERRPYSQFRRFASFGWVEKRKVYRQFGTPDIVNKVYPAEDDILRAYGYSWDAVERAAMKESYEAKRAGDDSVDPRWLLGKDYLMTAEEKIATGFYEGMMPKDTGPYLKQLFGSEWHSSMRI
jgi:hypothetical protein